DAVRRLPGVVAAGVGGSPMGAVMGVGGVTVPGDSRDVGMVGLTIVSRGYFEALGAHLKAGRFFNAHDRSGSATVAILAESAAHRLFPSGDAIGRTIVLPASGPVTVVGVLADMADWGDGRYDGKGGGIFLPHVQSSYVEPPRMLIKTTSDPQALIPAIRSI